MKKIEYFIKHQYQPSNTTCSPTALSMLLGHYGKQISVNDVSAKVPQVKNEKGKNSGTINIQMATWCKMLGFDVALYTADVQVIDQSWSQLSSSEVTERLKLRKNGLKVPSLGDLWNDAYCQAYIDFIRFGGDLCIVNAITSNLLYKLLKNGPILPCLSFDTLHGKGRTSNIGEKETKPDDVNGKAWNHSVVIYGNDEVGNFLIADPWEKPGHHVIEPDVMVAAIATAQLECDNMVFQLIDKPV